MGKETILHTDHHPLTLINSQSMMQEQRHLKWAAYIQRFNLIIKYMRGTTNIMAYLFFRPLVLVLHLLEVCCVSYGSWKMLYSSDPQFSPIWHVVCHPI